MNAFSFGSAQGEHLSVSEIAYERTRSGDFHDDNWLTCMVQIRAGAFDGRYFASVLTDEIHELHDHLARMHREVKGELSFTTLERQLEFTLSCDRLGHLQLVGIATDQPGEGQSLHFSLSLDQTDLARAVSELHGVLGAFPVRR